VLEKHGTTNFTVMFADGGQRSYYGTNLDYLTNTRLTGDITSGLTLLYPDGSQDVFGLLVTNIDGLFNKAMLTQRVNSQGQKTILNYYNYTPGTYLVMTPIIRLKSVVDGDGRTNLVYYNSTNAYSTNLISQVVDAFGRTNSLAYDNTGHLTNSVDVAGISSSFTYDANDWVSSLTTPYGSTGFNIIDTANAPVTRSVLVTQPDGGHQLYLYRETTNDVPISYPSGQIPNTSPYANTFDTNDLNLRNTFYWGPRQYIALSTTTISAFTSNDFLKAQMFHWLKTSNNVISQTISMKRDPSPDSAGTIQGQKTWYDYAGKTNSEYIGTQVMPLLAARVLPDGTTSFTRTECNSMGAMTAEVSTYSAGGSVALRTNLFGYDASGIDLLTTTNALGIQISKNIYNANHEVATNYDALNELTINTYDSSQRPTSTTLPSGLVTTNIYGADGFLAQRIAIGFATNSYTYTNALVYTHTDPRGLAITNIWDALNRLIGTAFPDGSSISNRYTGLDLTATKDRMGNWTYFGFDSMRRKVAETNAIGAVTLYDYCTCGSLESIQDALGNFTYFNYDNQGNATNTLYADGYSVSRTIDLLKRVIITTDSGGNSMTNFYDNQGLVYAVSNALGQVQGTAYDILDRATNNVDANGVSIGTTYDTLNRPLARNYPDGGVANWAYTLNMSGATSYTNQIGNITLYSFDAMNRKTNEVSVGVTTNKFTYNGANDLLTLTDGKNQTTSWNFDEYGRPTNKIDAASNILFVYKYDPGNRLTNRWSIAKGSTTYKFDPVNNLTNIVYPTSPPITMRYDSLNRRTNMTDAVGTTVDAYDAVGELSSEDGPCANDTLNYTYANRLRTALSLSQSSGSAWAQSYSYDLMRRMTNTASPAGGFGYQYVGYGPSMLVSRLALPNGAYITNSYDSIAQMLFTKLMNSSLSVLDSESYAYNLAGQRIAETNTVGDYRNYAYDNIGELEAATGKESGGTTNRLLEQYGYAYDAAQNLNYRTNNALIQTFNVNNLNELSTITRSGTFTVAGTTMSPATNVTVNTTNAFLYADTTFAATNFTLANGNNTFTAIAKDSYGRRDTNSITVNLPATINYGYDLNGNMLTNNLQVMDYDDENELIRVTVTSSFKKEYVYDGEHRLRIRKEFGWISSAWTQTNEIYYIYDGNVIIQTRDINNLPTLTLTRGSDFSSFLQNAGGIGSLLAMTENSAINPVHSYYHADGNGNITCLINANQIVVGKYLYDPFGFPLAISGSKPFLNPFWFSSQLYDSDTGFLHYKYRIYIPELDRWLNRDPIQENGGINLYGFLKNQPINRIDVLGLQSVPVSLSEAIAAGDVSQVTSILAGLTEDDAGYALARNFLQNVATCEAIYASYSALKCSGCDQCTTKEQAIANAACLSAEIAGRSAYIKKKCDYILAGSISSPGGSKAAEAGHVEQVAVKTTALVKCTAKIATLPSSIPSSN
jgi:RHS repeat-associated protein